jgi:hypothetical protein
MCHFIEFLRNSPPGDLFPYTFRNLSRCGNNVHVWRPSPYLRPSPGQFLLYVHFYFHVYCRTMPMFKFIFIQHEYENKPEHKDEHEHEPRHEYEMYMYDHVYEHLIIYYPCL